MLPKKYLKPFYSTFLISITLSSFILSFSTESLATGPDCYPQYEDEGYYTSILTDPYEDVLTKSFNLKDNDGFSIEHDTGSRKHLEFTILKRGYQNGSYRDFKFESLFKVEDFERILPFTRMLLNLNRITKEEIPATLKVEIQEYEVEDYCDGYTGEIRFRCDISLLVPQLDALIYPLRSRSLSTTAQSLNECLDRFEGIGRNTK